MRMESIHSPAGVADLDHVSQGVFIQRNGTMEWNGGMERWNGIVE